MKKLVVLIMLLLAAGAEAKTLSNGASLVPATDSVYSAVTKIDAEITKIYAYLNTLFKLQAAASAPTGNSTYDVWIDTSGSPALKYFDGAAWQVLVNPSAYSSGLTYAASVVGYSSGVKLEQDAATKSVMINATAAKPATIEVGGNMLQVASKITYNFTGKTEDTYYVKPVRTGSTTAFTLDVDDTVAGGTKYIGEVHTNGSAGVIKTVISYEGRDIALGNPLPGFVAVSQTAAKNTFVTATVIAYDTEDADAQDLFAFGAYTAPYSGWYRYDFIQTAAVGTSGTQCVSLRINSGVNNDVYCATDEYLSHTNTVHLEAGDTIEPITSNSVGTVAMYVTYPGYNSFKIWFAGGNY